MGNSKSLIVDVLQKGYQVIRVPNRIMIFGK